MLSNSARTSTSGGMPVKLCPTDFYSSACRGKKGNLHSKLSKASALDWGIQKNHAKLWGVIFASLTENDVLRFALTHDDHSPVLLRL